VTKKGDPVWVPSRARSPVDLDRSENPRAREARGTLGRFRALYS